MGQKGIEITNLNVRIILLAAFIRAPATLLSLLLTLLFQPASRIQYVIPVFSLVFNSLAAL